MSRFKLLAALVAAAIIAVSGGIIYIQHNRLNNLKVELTTSKHNYAALVNENSSLKDKNLTFQLTVDQLSNSKDSLVAEMNKVRKELKVKDKELKEMAYIASVATKTDTIYLKEEILKDKAPIDTLIQDEWHKLHINIDTNSLVITPEFKSEKYITSYIREEIVNPSRYKILNIFKKRESTLEVNIYEKNPYITNKKEKFIEVLK